MSKTIAKLMEKAATKGHAKNGAWEVEQVQGEFIRVKHYGTSIIKIEFNTYPATVTEIENPSMSDRTVMNFMLREFNLMKYPNTLKGFKAWASDTPSLFESDNVPGSKTFNYDKETKVFTESVKRNNFLVPDSEPVDYSSYYKYNEETGRFTNIDKSEVN